MDSERRYRLFFLVTLLLDSAVFWSLLANHRAPLGYHTFSYYTAQRWFLSAATGGAPPDGATFTAQAGLLQLVLELVPSLVRGRAFLPLFLLGVYLDELMLLVGVWLLARRFFDGPRTVFFVACAAMGTCLWTESIWYGLHSVAAVPLVIALAHGFLETGQRWRGALALNLLMMQAFGHLPGALFLPVLAVVAYFVAVRPVPAPIAWRPRDLAWAALGVAPLLLYLAMAAAGAGGGAGSGPGPAPPVPSLEDPGALDTLILGFPVSPDASLFCGTLTLAFAVMAGAMAPRVARRALGALALGVGALAVAAFTLGRLLPALAMGSVPVQAIPFARLVLIFLAGQGFHHWRRAGRGALAAAGATALLVAVLGGALSGLLTVSHRNISGGALSRFPTRAAEMLGASSLFGLLAFLLLVLWWTGPRARPLAMALALLLQPLEVFSWKFRTTWVTTGAVSPEQRALDVLAPLRLDSWLAAALGIDALICIAALLVLIPRTLVRTQR